jgi:hypothetical protein
MPDDIFQVQLNYYRASAAEYDALLESTGDSGFRTCRLAW